MHGVVAEYEVATQLLRLGYEVSKPLGVYAYDLVVKVGDKLLKVQVKTVEKNNRCRLLKKHHTQRYKPGEVDVFIIYHQAKQQCFVVPYKIVSNKTSMAIKDTTPKLEELETIMSKLSSDNNESGVCKSRVSNVSSHKRPSSKRSNETSNAAA